MIIWLLSCYEIFLTLNVSNYCFGDNIFVNVSIFNFDQEPVSASCKAAAFHLQTDNNVHSLRLSQKNWDGFLANKQKKRAQKIWRIAFACLVCRPTKNLFLENPTDCCSTCPPSMSWVFGALQRNWRRQWLEPNGTKTRSLSEQKKTTVWSVMISMLLQWVLVILFVINGSQKHVCTINHQLSFLSPLHSILFIPLFLLSPIYSPYSIVSSFDSGLCPDPTNHNLSNKPMWKPQQPRWTSI